MQFYCLYGINNQKTTTINLNQYMIRHLPIKNASPDQKKKLSKFVQDIINHLMESNGIYNEDILENIRSVEDIVFKLYDIETKEREMIVLDIKNKIDFYKKVYS